MPNLFDIPTDLNECFDDSVTALIESVGNRITLIYPGTIKTDCPNCEKNPMFKRSGNKYNTANSNPLGGPLHKSFTNFNTCPVCKGRGYVENSVPRHDTIKMIVVLAPKMSDLESLLKVGDSVTDNESMAYAVGYFTDEKKIKSCDHAKIRGVDYKRVGDPEALGIQNNKFLEMLWEKM